MSQISQFLMDEPLEEEDSVTSVSLRQAFVCSEGCLILAADYSQLELRILAHMSQDAKLMQILGPQNPDVFRAMAAKWKKKYLPEVTDTDRLVNVLVQNFTTRWRSPNNYNTWWSIYALHLFSIYRVSIGHEQLYPGQVPWQALLWSDVKNQGRSMNG